MYEIIFCDNDSNFIKRMKSILSRGGLKGGGVHYHEYPSKQEFMASMHKHTTIDLLFFDMKMIETDGNRTAKRFRNKFPESILIFCSGVCNPILSSIDVLPNWYILKEYTDKCMLHEIVKIIAHMRSIDSHPMIIGQYYSNIVRLEPKEILYLSVVKHGSKIHIHPDIKIYEFKDKLKSKMKLSELYEILKNAGFEYAHNSYIVNVRYIKNISETELEMIDKTVLSVARSKKINYYLSIQNGIINMA